MKERRVRGEDRLSVRGDSLTDGEDTARTVSEVTERKLRKALSPR